MGFGRHGRGHGKGHGGGGGGGHRRAMEGSWRESHVEGVLVPMRASWRGQYLVRKKNSLHCSSQVQQNCGCE